MNTSSCEAASSSRNVPRAIRWLVGTFAAVILLAAFVVPIGLATLFLAPMAVVFGIGMGAVWIARRRRQMLEGRDAEEIKDPFTTDRQWPTQGIIDDRLEMPTSDETRDGPP